MRERAVVEAWEKEKINSHLLEQQLAITQGVTTSHQEDVAHSEDGGSNPNDP
jgi:hypothetical protein